MGFYCAKTRIQAMAASDECTILCDRDPLWLQSSMHALISNYDQVCAVPKVPVPGTPRIQAATTKWLYHLAPEGYR
eukprot:6769439-Pyramimonas_sp.AAC.1